MKMRQKIALGLCAFYLFSVLGIALNLHFCSNELSSLSFVQKASCEICKPADSKKMAKKDNSCKDKTVEATGTDQDESSAKPDVPKNFSVALFFTPVIAEFMQYLLPGLFSNLEAN
jgi:hypothetical protein